MKTRYILLLIIIIFSGFVYIAFFHEVHLNEKVYTKGDITLKFYRISNISSMHDYIDLERFGYTKKIFKADTGGVYDILIKNDTIIIQTHEAGIYELVARTLDTEIIVDSSITTYQYMKKFQPQDAKYYKEQ